MSGPTTSSVTIQPVLSLSDFISSVQSGDPDIQTDLAAYGAVLGEVLEHADDRERLTTIIKLIEAITTEFADNPRAQQHLLKNLAGLLARAEGDLRKAGFFLPWGSRSVTLYTPDTEMRAQVLMALSEQQNIRGTSGPESVAMQAGITPLTDASISILPERVARDIQFAMTEEGRDMPTIHVEEGENADGRQMIDAMTGGKVGGSSSRYGGMESFLEVEELERLSGDELSILKGNVAFGERINQKFRRSQYYPLPRDLSFPPEKPLFKKWAAGRKSLVEIGVFEGVSSLTFRSAMSPAGRLHLIDPFVKVPDSKLTARPWMAQLSLLRSRNGRVQWYRDYSYNVVNDWKEPIDFLFIDGDHAERAARKDWLMWHPFVEVGGVALFHDARFGKGDGQYWDGWPGPTKVVDGLFRGPDKLPNWEIVDEAGSLVVVRRTQ